MVKILIGAVVAAFVLIVGFLIIDPDITVNQDDSADVADGTTTTGKYSIEGEVNKAGTYSFSDTPTMEDLINAAGGVTSNADEKAYYTTYELTSGKTYYIASLYDSSDLCNSSTITKVNVNTATAESLSAVNGITNAVANSIVSHRDENGDFYCIEDLLDVYGIGNATYRKIRNYVILHE